LKGNRNIQATLPLRSVQKAGGERSKGRTLQFACHSVGGGGRGFEEKGVDCEKDFLHAGRTTNKPEGKRDRGGEQVDEKNKEKRGGALTKQQVRRSLWEERVLQWKRVVGKKGVSKVSQ